MQKILKYTAKSMQILLTVLLIFLLICNLYLIIMNRILGVEHPTILGYSTAVVISGSMEPALSVDDLILNYVQTNYREGDIITFQKGDSLTTHRIIEITDAGYVTRGDANNAADPDCVPSAAVIGRVVGVVPYIGSVLAVLKTPMGMFFLILTGLCMIELPFFFQRRRDKTDGGGIVE